MIPVLYAANATDFTTNGIGRLAECTYCTVTEERNGVFELELEIPTTAKYFGEIEENRLIVAQPRPGAAGQPFRIWNITKPLNGVVTVYARHLSYDLNKIVAMPFVAQSCAAALVAMKSAAANTCLFDFWTDKVVSATMNVQQPTEMRGLLGGQEGSVLDVYGTGEYEFDGYEVRLYQNRGVDRGVSIRYGKNLTALEDSTDTTNVYTGIVPFYRSDLATVVLPEMVLWGEHRDDYPFGMVKVLDLSSQFETPPTVAQLRAAAQTYLDKSTGWQISDSLKISFVNLADTEEYKDVSALQRVNLCDTVHVVHPALGIEATAKVVSVVYDAINERYTSMELGASRTNLSQAITDEIMEDVPTTSMLQQAIDHANKMITGGLGGYFQWTFNANGQPIELLVLNDLDKERATSVWRWNLGGLGHGSSYDQPANDVALTADGKINATMITTGVLNAAIIKTGVITGQASGTTMQIDVDNGVITLGDKSLVVNATNFKLASNGDLTITGTINATGGKIGAFTLTDALYYGNKDEFSDTTETGGYIGKEGIAFGAGGSEHSLFEIDVNGCAYSQFMYYLNGDGRPTRYSWHNMYGYYGNYNDIIATSGAIDVNIENYGTTRLWNNNQIDGYQKISSDRRLKKDIRYLSQQESAEIVLKLKPAEFRFKDTDPYYRGLRHGFIAQDLVEIVGDDEDNSPFIEIQRWDGMYGIRYQELIADVVNVVQMQQKRIDELEQRLAYVESLLEGDGK